MHTGRWRKLAALAVCSTALLPALAACGSSSSAKPAGGSSGSSVTVAAITSTSGPAASLGVPGLNGLKMAIDDLNRHGGLLGKKINLVVYNDQADPNLGQRYTREAVLNDHPVALFGAVSSAVCAAEEQVASQYHVPIFFDTCNDVHLTTTGFSPYVFSVVPNTYMESRAIAYYFKQQGWTQLATISPNYSYGRDEVSGLLSSLKGLGANVNVLTQQWPPLGAPNFTTYITALLNAHPQAVFGGIYGTDLLNFTKEAFGFNFFQKTHFGAQYGSIDLQALGNQAPVGAVAWDRAPFWAFSSLPAVKALITSYHAKYGSYPAAWTILSYAAVQTWAYGVKKAGSFNADKVSQALAGATVPTIRGDIVIRGCDHQAIVPEYLGVVGPSSTYPFDTWTTTEAVPPQQIMMSCSEVLAARNNQ